MRIIKKHWAGLFILTGAVMIASCADNKQEQVKKFAADFATKVSKNQKDSLLVVWPDAAKADSLALTFNPDSIKVEPTQTEGQFKVNFGNADMIVAVAEDGKMTVGETNGLFAWPEEKLQFAKKTGWVEPGMNDVQMAERFSDKDFESSLVENFEKDFLKKFSIEHKVPNRDWDANVRESIYVVKNNSASTIDGSDYEISIPFFKEMFMFDPNPKRWNETKKGKTISPNGSVTYVEWIVIERGDFSRYGPVFNGHTIVLKLKGKDLFNKYYSATGNEYQEYLDAKER